MGFSLLSVTTVLIAWPQSQAMNVSILTPTYSKLFQRSCLSHWQNKQTTIRMLAAGNECNKLLLLVTILVQVRTMGEAWDETVKRSNWAACMMMYWYKADREKEPPYSHSEKCSTASLWSGLEKGGLRGSAASPNMVQQWYARIKSLVLYQPYWGEIRGYSDGFMVAQHRTSHES